MSFQFEERNIQIQQVAVPDLPDMGKEDTDSKEGRMGGEVMKKIK